MMLQGHFVDTLLSPVYRDPNSIVFNAWFFMRGITAPVFFTVTGIVFVFLLLKENKPLREHVRVRKGIRRAFLLIALGYLLKWNVGYLLTFQFFPYHFTVDVLHVIGFALLTLIGVYALHRVTSVSFPWLSGLLGLVVFLLFPLIEARDWSWLPRFMENYLNLQGGSTFTLFPWLGYTLLGGVIGAVAHRFTALFKHWLAPALIFGAGLFLHFYSVAVFDNLNLVFASKLSAMWVEKNYLFWRFGHVLIVLSVFVFLEQVLRKGFHPLFLKIGSETLTVYGGHYVLLYGTWFGIGLTQLWKLQLNPVQAVLGVLLFEAFFILMIAHIEKIRQVLYKDLPAAGVYLLRWTRVKVLRSAHFLLLRYKDEAPAFAAQLSVWVYRALTLVFHFIPAAGLRKGNSQ